jgi:hypothetical protein
VSGWIWTSPHIVGSLDLWETVYDWDGSFHASREAAIKAGLELYGSDDFNVAHIVNGQIVWFGWMEEKWPDEDYAEVATALGLTT